LPNRNGHLPSKACPTAPQWLTPLASMIRPQNVHESEA
jgi:hypothetical protein